MKKERRRITYKEQNVFKITEKFFNECFGKTSFPLGDKLCGNTYDVILIPESCKEIFLREMYKGENIMINDIILGCNPNFTLAFYHEFIYK